MGYPEEGGAACCGSADARVCSAGWAELVAGGLLTATAQGRTLPAGEETTMAEPTAKLTLKVGDKEVHFEAGVNRVEAQLHRLASEMLKSGEPSRSSVFCPMPLPFGPT